MGNVKIAFYDAKEYDRISFDKENSELGYEITYFETRLTENTYALASGYDAVCVFVNDVVNKAVIDGLVSIMNEQHTRFCNHVCHKEHDQKPCDTLFLLPVFHERLSPTHYLW